MVVQNWPERAGAVGMVYSTDEDESPISVEIGRPKA
jgi:hypothetical protein